jgi:hypothetical protein
VADWNAIERLVAAVRPKLAEEARRLQVLLTESRESLAPLEDPFDIDLGLHRWLDGEREEAYSDWLEWVVGQAKTPDRVFRLFSLPPPPCDTMDGQHLEVKRECCVPRGHVDREGRLDLVVRFGDQAIIIVEVKTGDAEDADTAKQGGYRHWLDAQSYPLKRAVLVAVSADQET